MCQPPCKGESKALKPTEIALCLQPHQISYIHKVSDKRHMSVVFFIFLIRDYLESINFYFGASCMVGQHLKNKKRYHSDVKTFPDTDQDVMKYKYKINITLN